MPFDCVCLLLCMYPRASLRVPAGMHAHARAHAHARPACEFEIWICGEKKTECDCGAVKGYVGKTNYVTTAFSFDIVTGNLQMLLNKEV